MPESMASSNRLRGLAKTHVVGKEQASPHEEPFNAVALIRIERLLEGVQRVVPALPSARYWKRFGGNSFDLRPHILALGSRKPSGPQRDAHVPERVSDAAGQAGNLVCYLMNLTDNLQKWLAQGAVAPVVLPQVIEELRKIAEALNT
jgi:hypothetical protein